MPMVNFTDEELAAVTAHLTGLLETADPDMTERNPVRNANEKMNRALRRSVSGSE